MPVAILCGGFAGGGRREAGGDELREDDSERNAATNNSASLARSGFSKYSVSVSVGTATVNLAICANEKPSVNKRLAATN